MNQAGRMRYGGALVLIAELQAGFPAVPQVFRLHSASSEPQPASP
jgi:hypothetical protein